MKTPKEIMLEGGIAKVYMIKKYYKNKKFGRHPLEKHLFREIIEIREKYIEILKKEIYEN